MKIEEDQHDPESAQIAPALRDAINARRVTLAWLHERLRERGNTVSMATLSYWRSGARRPEGAQSVAALTDIESLLDLEVGALTRLLGRSHRTGPVGSAHFPLDANDIERAVTDAYAALGVPYPSTSREVTTHSVTDVGPDGNVALCSIRSIVQATTGTVDAIPFLEMTPGIDAPAPTFTAVAGGRLNALYSHPNGEVHGGRFDLDAPLTAPDTTMVEWSISYPQGYPPTRESGYAVSRQCRELVLWIRFHPDALPDWCEERVETPEGSVITPVSVKHGRAVHLVHRAFGPGAVELRWGYGPRE
ncbi:hypothetical protein LTA6_001377 [Microbacterium sp. LTA6]|uniref:hypothetical protein n=1 Tax=unclassified Microbacterium TaxID=2609290 RepID=UPI003138FF86